MWWNKYSFIRTREFWTLRGARRFYQKHRGYAYFISGTITSGIKCDDEMKKSGHKLWEKDRSDWNFIRDSDLPVFKSKFLDWEHTTTSVYRFPKGYSDKDRFHEDVDKYDVDVANMMLQSRFYNWRKFYQEPYVGHTEESFKKASWKSCVEGFETTCMRVKSLHHILSFEELLSRSLFYYDTIVEFGAGSGELARTLFDAGWKGNYKIIDFPEIQRWQKFYLKDFSVDFYPNFEDISDLPGKSLFLSTWGFSETPLELREALTQKLKPSAWAILFQLTFQEINNLDYFANVFPWQSETAHRVRQLIWHKGDGGNFYYTAFKIK